jgi:hypothetical protein
MRATGWRIRNETRAAILAERVFAATSFFARLRGLIGHRALDPGAALWIRPCQQVHTHFMRDAVHVLFLDDELRVVCAVESLRPWRISPWVRRARSVLEFSARVPLAAGAGDRLALLEPGEAPGTTRAAAARA